MIHAFISPQRYQELRGLLILALPVLGGQLAQTGNGFVDIVMAGRVSATDLAAVAVGASIWIPIFLLMTGVLMSATAILARHFGHGEYHRLNPLTQQALWLALGLSLLGMLAIRNMAPVLELMDVEAAMRPIVLGYLEGLSWGIPAAAAFLAMRSYTESLGHTKPVFWISLFGLLMNIPINYALIYGKFGLPELGGVGCGWATAVVMWVMAIAMYFYTRKSATYAKARLDFSALSFEPHNILYMLKVGLPTGLTIFFEVSLFSVIALLLGPFGAIIVAGHQVALNFTGLLFMLPLSLAIAVTIRVGHARGRSDKAAASYTIGTALRLTVFTATLMAGLILLFRHQVPFIYTNDMAVHAVTTGLLFFAALYQIPDALQVTANGALRGFEDTTVPMMLTLVAYWGVGLPVGFILARTDWVVPMMGAAGFWIGLIAGLSTAAVLLGLRLRYRLAQPLVSYKH